MGCLKIKRCNDIVFGIAHIHNILSVHLQEGYWQSVRTFQQHVQFLEGMLLKEIKGQGEIPFITEILE